MLIQLVGSILAFAGIGFIGLLIARRVALPYSLILVCLGFITSFLLEPLGWDTGIRANNFQDLMLFVLLPILIFEAAFSLDSQRLFKFMPNILTLATLGLLISTTLTALLLFIGIDHAGFPIIAALIAGVVVSATDPVAVVSQLKQMKAPEDLNVLIEGESLFNDATAIVLFSILVAVALGDAQPSALAAIGSFVLVFAGGILVGAWLGWLAAKLIQLIEINTANVGLTTLLLAYGSFYLAEHSLHVSGIVAVLFAAISFRRFSKDMAANVQHEVHQIWQFLGSFANIFVFVLLGLVVSLDMFSVMWLAIIIAIAAALVARVVAVYCSVWLNRFTIGQPIPDKYPPVMIWGGLRGAVTIALVLSLPTELPYWWTIQSIGFGVVLFTLIVQATTNPMLMRKLDL
jgi:CPA1 family monovalent cation:H+ antiporter